MTNAQVQEVQTLAAAKGRPLSSLDAAIYLSAREISKNPAHPLHEHTVKSLAAYSEYLVRGTAVETFSIFLLPYETDEEIARFEKVKVDRLAYLEKQKENMA